MTDTFTAFQAFVEAGLSCSVRVAITPDPLGPVNRIVTLRNGERRVKATLRRVPAGAKVELIHEHGMRYSGLGWRTLNGLPEEPEPEWRAPGWYVHLDGQVVLYATAAEVWPLPPVPPVPWRVRARRAARRVIRERVRPHADRIAERLGYHRDDDCGVDW